MKNSYYQETFPCSSLVQHLQAKSAVLLCIYICVIMCDVSVFFFLALVASSGAFVGILVARYHEVLLGRAAVVMTSRP